MLPDKLVIPQICRNSNLLICVIVTQIAVMIMWLVNADNTSVSAFGLWSLYGLWLVLLTTLSLCWLRAWIACVPYLFGALLIFILYLAVLLSIEAFIAHQFVMPGDQIVLNWERVFRMSLVGLIVLVLMLRLFAFLDVLENRNKAEAESKVLALQSRINPHFLFNSLNTISELTSIDPQQAEKAIHSLSILFRASLENNRTNHSLEHELLLCQRYLELEAWRLGSKLEISWRVEVETQNAWRVPKLILQPLIENAIVHGKQDNGRVMVTIDLRESNKYLSLMIENELGNTDKPSGHGIAIDNIRERLFTLYDDQYVFRVKQTHNKHRVLMRIPKKPSTTIES